MGLNIGIVGAGIMGGSHASRYASLPDVDVTAVADVDRESAQSLAGDHGASAYADHRDLIADDDVDAASVCVHNNLHAPIVIDALEAGLDVFCEKPMAGSYADAKRMYDAAEEAGGHLGIQNGELYSPAVRAARRLIDAGRLGELYHGTVSRYSGSSPSPRRGRPYLDGYGSPSFVESETAGGGPVYDLGTYAAGRLLYLFGNPDVERVKGRTFHVSDALYDATTLGDDLEMYRERREAVDFDVEDVGLGIADLADGSTVVLRTAWAMHSQGAIRDEVVGTEGGVAFDPFEYVTTTADLELTASADLDAREWRLEQFDPDRAELGDLADDPLARWVRAVRGEADDPPRTDAIALNAMAFLEGIYLSERLDREVSRDEVAERSESTALEP